VSAAVELLARQALASAVLPGLALLLLWRSQDAGPRRRHRLLVTALAATLLVPWLSWSSGALPAIQLAPPFESAGRPASPPLARLPLGAVPELGAPARAAGAPLTHWMVWVVWAGSGLQLLRLAAAWCALRRLRSRCDFDTSVARLAEGCARSMGFELAPRIGLGPTPVPMAIGILHPWIALPAGAERWPPERLRSVLLHELAHVRRRDPSWRALAALARALHWWNPLVHAAAAALEREQEHAADDAAVAFGREPAAYATDLLAVAAKEIRLPLAASISASRDLERRLRRIVEPRRPPGRVAPLATVVLPALALSVAVPGSPARPPVTDGAFRRPAGLLVNQRGQLSGGRCSPGDEFWVYVTREGAMAFNDAVRFTDDAAELSPGGYLLVERRTEESFDRVEVHADDRAGLHFRQHLGGRPLAETREAPAWLGPELQLGLAELPARHPVRAPRS
jgi:hypothetical protein